MEIVQHAHLVRESHAETAAAHRPTFWPGTRAVP
jgi:hypothetical protein